MADRSRPQDPVVIPCCVKGCTAPASFGFGVFLTRGKPGRRYCRKHHHLGQDQARAPPAPPPASI